MTSLNGWPAITEGTLTPAYSRNYASSEQAIADFLAGKDFRWNHPMGDTYCSIRDFQPGQQAKIRYHYLEEVIFVQVPK